jgi:hypothetical protein
LGLPAGRGAKAVGGRQQAVGGRWDVACGVRRLRATGGPRMHRLIVREPACWEVCHPDPAVREKDLCHFARGKLRGESRHWIEETLFHWTSTLRGSFVVPIRSGPVRVTAHGPPDVSGLAHEDHGGFPLSRE